MSNPGLLRSEGVDPRRLWLAVGLAAVALRLAFAMASGRLWHPEIWEYESIANHLLRGDGFIYQRFGTVYRSYCEPLYPGLVALVYAVSGHSQLALVLVQILLSSVTAVVAAACGWLLTKDLRVSGVSGALVALHPGLVLYATKLHPLVLDALFMTSVACASLAYAERPSGQRAACLGAACGFCLLTRPTIVAVLPLIAWWVWRATGRNLGRRVARVGLVMAVMAALGAPWVARNYLVHGRFMLMRSTTPLVFWLGNNPNATGSALDPHGRDVLLLAPQEFSEQILVSDELTQNRLFAAAAWAYVRADVPGFFRRWWQKWVYFWWFSPQAGVRYRADWMEAYRVWWAVLVVIGGWGLWITPRLAPACRRAVWFLVGMVAIIGAVQSLFYIEGRHRLAVEPALSSIIALGARQLWIMLSPRREGKAT